MNGIYCLSVEGAGLTADVRNGMLIATSRMRQESKTRISVKTKYFEGMIKTKLETKTFGSLSGILFEAEIESPSGKTKAVFIINEGELLRTPFDEIEVMVWQNLFTGEVQTPEKVATGYDPVLNN